MRRCDCLITLMLIVFGLTLMLSCLIHSVFWRIFAGIIAVLVGCVLHHR